MRDLVAEFEKFDAENPKLWLLFCRFCDQAIAVGRRKLGVSLIIERIRWEVFITTTSDDDFKINNNHRAYYARKWLAAHPEYPGFFETRKVRNSGGSPPGWDDDGQGNLFT